MAIIVVLADFDQTSSGREIRSRHDLNMVGTSFESLGAIVFEKISLIKFLHLFVPFCNQKGIIQIGKNRKSANTVLVTKRYKKV